MSSRYSHNHRKGRGAKWISKPRRQAIYNRDNRKCVYCLAATDLSLDHLKPRSKGGSNESSNLITCCFKCNSSRQDRTVRSFCIAVGAYLNVSWRLVLKRVKNAARRKVTVERKANQKDRSSGNSVASPAAHRKQDDVGRNSRHLVDDLRLRMQVPAPLACQDTDSGKSRSSSLQRAVQLAKQEIPIWVSDLGNPTSEQTGLVTVHSSGLIGSADWMWST